MCSGNHKFEASTQTPDLNLQLLINSNFKPVGTIKKRNGIVTNPRIRKWNLHCVYSWSVRISIFHRIFFSSFESHLIVLVFLKTRVPFHYLIIIKPSQPTHMTRSAAALGTTFTVGVRIFSKLVCFNTWFFSTALFFQLFILKLKSKSFFSPGSMLSGEKLEFDFQFKVNS